MKHRENLKQISIQDELNPNSKSPAFEDIEKYDQLGRDLQSKAIFSMFKSIKRWFISRRSLIKFPRK